VRLVPVVIQVRPYLLAHSADKLAVGDQTHAFTTLEIIKYDTPFRFESSEKFLKNSSRASSIDSPPTRPQNIKVLFDALVSGLCRQ
jgi:hypothetical protein